MATKLAHKAATTLVNSASSLPAAQTPATRRTVIKNAVIVSPSGCQKADILIENGTIIGIGPNLSGDVVIDASGQYVTPGGVDAHVHLQYHVCGYDTSDNFANGMEAAALGGTTTVIDFVEAQPDETLQHALERRSAQAAPGAVIDYGLHMSILPSDMDKLGQIGALIADGCPTFKHYMAYGFALNDGQLYESCQAIGKNGGMALVHAENWDVIQRLVADIVKKGHREPRYHMDSRPAFLEAQAVERALDVANLADCPAYICHLTCAADVEKLQEARKRGQRAWGETCTHYCWLNDSAFETLGLRAICSPPLRPEEERQAIASLVSQGLLHTVSTDHCPFTSAEKLAKPAFNEAPGGLSGIQGRMMLMRDLPGLSLENWVNVCCTMPAQLMGLQRKGLVACGYDADLVIWKDDPHTLKADELHERADWSPFEGMTVSQSPEYVLCRGEIVAHNGEIKAKPGFGKYVKRYLAPAFQSAKR